MPTVAVRTGMTLAYEERGRLGEPAVVMLPGPTDSWRSYEPVLERVPSGVHVVAVSLRGHGGSSTPPTGYSVEDLASDVVPFLDAMGIDAPVLAGHSGSCLVARRVALDDLDRVRGLFLEASPATLRGDEGLARFVEDVVGPLDAATARRFLADTSTTGLPTAFVETMVDDLVEVPLAVWREVFAALTTYDDTDELARLDLPVALVWGDADGLVGADAQAELVRRLPDAQLLVYEGVGHTPRWEQPERYARDLVAFVERLLSGR